MDGRFRLTKVVCALVSFGLITLGTVLPVQAATSHTSTQTLSLTVGISSDSASFMDLYYAEYANIFKNVEHLNLTVDVEGAGVITDVVTGQTVIGVSGLTGGFSADLSGMPIQAVYSTATGVNTGAIVVPTGSSITSLMGLSGQRVAVVGVGGSSYGAASTYSQYIVSQGGMPLTIVSVSTAAATLALLASGGAAAAIGTADLYASGIAAGQDTILLSANSAQAKSLLGTSINSVGFYGTTSALAANKVAVERFLAGLALSDKEIASLPLTTQEAVLAKETVTFSTDSASTLASSISYDSPFWTQSDGVITQESWANSISFFNTWGLSLNVANPKLDFQNYVNMSYRNAGTAVPTAPKNVKVTVAANGSLKVKWAASSAVTPVKGYTATSSPGAKSCTTTGGTSCTIKGLKAGTAYVVHVTATNAFGKSKVSLSKKS